jgi:hypothetical protein
MGALDASTLSSELEPSQIFMFGGAVVPARMLTFPHVYNFKCPFPEVVAD